MVVVVVWCCCCCLVFLVLVLVGVGGGGGGGGGGGVDGGCGGNVGSSGGGGWRKVKRRMMMMRVWCVFIGGVSELHLEVTSYGEEGGRSGIVIDIEPYSDCLLWGRFGYEEGTLQYLGGENTVIEDVDSDCWSIFEAYAELGQFGYTRENIVALWYKDPASQWLEKALKLFATDRDALKMCKIANLRGHVEVFVVHVVEDAEEFSEAGFIDVGGQTE
ncbi:hypothetical protein Ahy_B09g098562 [Arachis hypogaea]|uniref:PB1-like domain-containing protein n=1 Tax=Arachis hypogaea TaxID=3818 RepID=A0A444XRN0_ARAHY|nr:hypothetical protein Ahy_B09g098562 [Arachis hypogaea]